MSFSAIKGQDRPVEVLKSYIKNSCLEGGYLFVGPEGVGKKMTALGLAETLNCSDSRVDTCGNCPSCLKIKNNQHPDVHIISNEDAQIKIDQIRQLQRDINLKAYEGAFKVFIIDNAHTLTAEASNSLLKILEEPPKKSVIILISDKPGLLFKTVVSRCKVLKFPALKRKILEGILKKDYKLDTGFAHFLAYFSEGRLGRALKLKDENMVVEKNHIIDKFILANRPKLEGLAEQKREEVRKSLNLLAVWFRDIYLLKIGMPEEEVINSDRSAELMQSASRYSFLDLDRILTGISSALGYLEQNVNTRLLLYNLGIELWKA